MKKFYNLKARAGSHQMIVRIADREDPDQIASSVRSSLIWVCIICLGFVGRQLVFKILVHLQ